MAADLTLPPGIELNLDAEEGPTADGLPDTVDENVDGEESKEAVPSHGGRVRGTTMIKRCS